MLMGIQHTARTGKNYYLHVGEGKSGKPSYYFSMDAGEPLVETLPEGFEVYENVQGQVFLRRCVPQLITPEECALVRQSLNRHAEEWLNKIEVKKNILTIYEASNVHASLESVAMPWISKDKLKEYAIRSTYYMAVMRFVLVDRRRRLFNAERFCFRGSVDDWIDISYSPQPLPIVVKKYIKHLGRDSLYELF
jgi:hypothetical protein